MQPRGTETKRRSSKKRPDAGRRVRGAIDRISDAYIAICLDTSTIFDLNPAAETLFGAAPDILLRREFSELIAPDYLREYESLESRLDAGEDSGPMRMLFKRLSGELVPVEFTVVEIPSVTTLPAPLRTTTHPSRRAICSAAAGRALGRTGSASMASASASRRYSPGWGVRIEDARRSRSNPRDAARAFSASASMTRGISSRPISRSTICCCGSSAPRPGPTARQSKRPGYRSSSAATSLGASAPA
ncbi:MAG: PAS domain S-box protein [Planctomycetes bacterium]|nr:PAS domain S-box protein [Planctomycetota bacterium]